MDVVVEEVDAIIVVPPESNENTGLKGLGNSPKLSPAFRLARWGFTIGELLVEVVVGPVLFLNELALDSPPPPLKEDLENRWEADEEAGEAGAGLLGVNSTLGVDGMVVARGRLDGGSGMMILAGDA